VLRQVLLGLPRVPLKLTYIVRTNVHKDNR
jgi:hypothetical protein